MLDTIAPYFGKNSAPPGPKPIASTSNSGNAVPVDAAQRGRMPSYEKADAIKGTDGVIYRAAGARGKGAKQATVPVVAPTAVAPGCVTTAPIHPSQMGQGNEVPNTFGNGLRNTNEASSTATTIPSNTKIHSSFHGQFKTLDEIRAAFPMSGSNSKPTTSSTNNNVIKVVEKKMQDPWQDPSKGIPTKGKPILTSPDNSRLLYDPKRRRGRPLDIPDQTIILAPPTPPSTETTPPGFKKV